MTVFFRNGVSVSIPRKKSIRGQKKMKLMVSLTLLTMNAMALGKIEQGVT